MTKDGGNTRPDLPMEAPTPKKCVPVTLAEYFRAAENADDVLYRITTVSVNPLTEYEQSEVSEGIHELKPTSPADSPAAYENLYEMTLWEMEMFLVPWTMRTSGGLKERIIDVQRLGRFKGPHAEIERT